MKIDRLLAMTVLLLNRQRVSAKELAERFEVSTKTIYRDMETLSQSGIPIVAHQGISGGFEIMEQFTIHRQLLTLKEIASMIAALKGAASALDDSLLGDLLEKVKALLSRSEQVDGELKGSGVIFDFNPWGQSTLAREKVSILREAIDQSRRVKIEYMNSSGSESERVIEPANLILKGSIWYLQAYCTVRNNFRVFRLSRIQGLQILRESCTPREIPPLDTYAWDSEWSAETEQEMILIFHPQVRSRVQDTFPLDRISLLEDGSIQIKGRFTCDEWFYGMLLSYGDRVKVEHPAAAAEEIRLRAQKIMELYWNQDI